MKSPLLSYLYHRSRRWIVSGFLLQGHRSRFTPSLIIETTNVCSLRCSCCPNGSPVPKRPRGIMSRDTFDAVLRNLDVPVKSCFLHMCGEPFLNPDLDYFCSRLLEQKIFPTVFSNGYGIDLALLDRLLALKGVRISFSMEIHSPVDYEHFRVPGHHPDALGHLEEIDRHFSEANRVYGLNIIVTPGHTAAGLARISRRLFGQFSRLSNITFSGEWPWPSVPGTGDIAGHLVTRPRMCPQYKELPTVLWDGRASFCNLDYAGELIVGSAADTPMSEIVNNRHSRRLRRSAAMHFIPRHGFCKGCLIPRYRTFTLNVTRAALRSRSDRDFDSQFDLADKYFSPL